MTTEVEFTFEQLFPRDEQGREITGLTLSGTAFLQTDDPDYEKYGFIVRRIDLTSEIGVYHLDNCGSEKWLFDKIKAVIYDENTAIGADAQATFRDAVDDAEPVKPFMGRVYRALENRT